MEAWRIEDLLVFGCLVGWMLDCCFGFCGGWGGLKSIFARLNPRSI